MKWFSKYNFLKILHHTNETPKYSFNAVIMNKMTNSHKEIRFLVLNEDLIIGRSTREECAYALDIQVLAITLFTVFLQRKEILFWKQPSLQRQIILLCVCQVEAGEVVMGRYRGQVLHFLPQRLDSSHSRATVFLVSP